MTRFRASGWAFLRVECELDTESISQPGARPKLKCKIWFYALGGSACRKGAIYQPCTIPLDPLRLPTFTDSTNQPIKLINRRELITKLHRATRKLLGA